MTTIAAMIAAPILAGGGYWWTIPLLLLALLAGLYPSRRRIFSEQWSFGEYLRHAVFSGIGMIGFWMALALSPAAIAGMGAIDARLAFLAAAVLAALLIVCQLDYPRFWLAMHRSTPFERADLAPRFEEILSRATCPRPAVHRFGAKGGYVMNALALPHRSRPAVAFGDALLERLEPREIAAVFAHEVAHLEYFGARRLRRLAFVSLALIALSTLLTAILVVTAPALATWLTLGIMITIVGTLGVIASKSQANETASDLRAIELTGDADALISALTRLHVHLRLPRQWPHEIEASVSHPSLARRIKAIRERAQVAAPALRRTTVARTPAATVRIALDDARAYWFEGLPPETPDDLSAMRERASSYRALSYDELSELRLVPSGGGTGKALKARDLTGRSWLVTVRAEDVPPLHEALSVVDARLGQRRSARTRAVPQLLAAAMLLALLAAGQAGVVLVPAIVLLIRPATAPLAALGAMAIARAVVALTSGDVPQSELLAAAGLSGIVVLGVIALVLAWRAVRTLPSHHDAGGASGPDAPGSRSRRHDSADAHDARLTLVSLGATAGLVTLLLVPDVSGAPVVESLASPLVAALAVVGLGLAAAMASMPARSVRRAGAALAIVAIVSLVVGTRSARIVMGPPLRADEHTAVRVDEVRLEHGGYRLEVSPAVRHFAVQGAPDHEIGHDEDDITFRWTVGALDGGTRMLDAADLGFVDDERILTMRPQRDSLVLGLEQVIPPLDEAADSPGWRLALPPLMGPQLFVDQPARRWSVVGHAAAGELVAFSGSIDDETDVVERRWKADSVWMQPMHVTSDGSVIGYSIENAGAGAWAALTILTGPAMRFSVWRRHDGGRRRLGTVHGVPQCRAHGGGFICAGRATDRSQLWGSIPEGGAGPLGVLPAGWDVRNIGHGGSLVAVERAGHRVIVVDPSDRRTTRIALDVPDGAGRRMLLDARSDGAVVATLEMDGAGTCIGVYRVR